MQIGTKGLRVLFWAETQSEDLNTAHFTSQQQAGVMMPVLELLDNKTATTCGTRYDLLIVDYLSVQKYFFLFNILSVIQVGSIVSIFKWH